MPGASDTRAAAPGTFLQVFNNYLKPGGEEASVARIARHLEQGGHTVHRFWRSSAEWRVLGAPPRWRQPLLLWNNPAVLHELEALHRLTQPRAWILHNVIPVVSLGIYPLARRLGVPIFQWLHNYRPLSPSSTLTAWGKRLRPDDPWRVAKEVLAGLWHGRMLTAWLALSYRRLRRRGDFESVRAWVAVSDDVRQTFLDAGWFTDRLFTLRHAWDTQAAQAPERDENYFLFLGRMVETKGVRFLIDLWRRPELRDVPLVLCGEGPLRDELSGTTPPNVRWPGFVQGDEKRRLVAGSRAVLFPCLWSEPLSTVAYEAYEQGKPMVSSALGGMKELVVDGQTGRLLPAGNAMAWLEAILELVRNPTTARRLGQEGRRWLDTNVSPTAWNRQFDDLCRATLNVEPPTSNAQR
jgi:glycosyltransferase involved in cell wall biosynthesis